MRIALAPASTKPSALNGTKYNAGVCAPTIMPELPHKVAKVELRMTEKINLQNKLDLFVDYFAPRTVAQFNGHDVMLAKLKGPFIWHKHDDTDDFFLVIRGTLEIELRDQTIALGPGEMYVVPRGVEHRPTAREEVHLLLIEPSGTANTGDSATAAPRQFI